MKKLLFLTLLINYSSYSSELCQQHVVNNDSINSLQNIIATTPLIDCSNITRPISKQTAKEMLKTFATQQKLGLGNTSQLNRHQIGDKLNNCKAKANQKAFVINFEGTGSFSPKTADLMKTFMGCVGDGDLGKSLYYHAIQAIKETYHQSENWSALSAGPLNQLAMNGDSRNIGWTTFASEESEVLGNPKELSSYSSVSSQVFPRGVYRALLCYRDYRQSAKELGITPKIVIQGHSSGARSSVKFLENMKTLFPEDKVDLMLTIDPVKEAHLAVGEVLSQIAGNANREIYNAIPFVDDVEIKPPNVWTRRQPNALYKPDNVTRSVNVYQNVDTDGLKGPVKFGIHGSPIHGADINQFISKDLGSDAHGEITRHEKTKSIIASEYKKIGLIP